MMYVLMERTTALWAVYGHSLVPDLPVLVKFVLDGPYLVALEVLSDKEEG